MIQSYWKFLQLIANNTDFKTLMKTIAGRDVYIRGANQRGIFYKEILEKNGIKVKGFIDSYKIGKDIYRPREIIFRGNSSKVFLYLAMQYAHKDILDSELSDAGFSESDYIWPFKEWLFMGQKQGNRTDCSHQNVFLRGAKIFFQLNPNKLYFFVYGGHIGEAGMVLSWLQAFKEKHYVKDISIITVNLFKSICEVYDITNEIIVYSDEEAYDLDHFVRDRCQCIYNVFGSEWLWVDYSHQIPFDMSHTLYKIFTMGISGNTPSRYFKIDENNSDIISRLRNTKLVYKRSVILIPYARSSQNLPTLFWEKLVTKLKPYFSVYTNCSGDEIPIKGTEDLRIPIGDMPYAVRYAGAAVSIRCGITDILALGESEETMVLYYVPTEIDLNYAKVNARYINGEDSILFRNAIFLEQSYDDEYVTDMLTNKIKQIILKGNQNGRL